MWVHIHALDIYCKWTFTLLVFMRYVQKICTYSNISWTSCVTLMQQPIRVDHTVHVWTYTLLWSYSVNNKMPFYELVYYGTIIFTVNIYQILLQTWTFIHEYYPNDSEGFQGYSMSEILMKLLYWCFKLARNPLKAIYIL